MTHTIQTDARPSFVPALDGVRGVAILTVVAYHLTLWASVMAPLEAVWRWAKFGHVGVDLFFVLSGFLITGILWDSRDDASYLKNFFARRALRILPLYYAVVLALAVLAPLAAPHDGKLQQLWSGQIWLWTYTSNIAVAVQNAWSFNALNHFWSLAVEEQFYLVWPFVVWRLRRETLMTICFTFAVVAACARGVLIESAPGPALGVYTLTVCRMDALLLGAALALEVRGPSSRRWRWSVISQSLAGPALLTAFIAWGLPLVGTGGDVHPQAWVDGLVPPCWAVAFAGLVSASLDGGRIAQVLRSRVLRFFGRHSYGMYVFHYPLHPVFERLVPIRAFHSTGVGTAVFAITGLALTTAVAWVSRRFFEAPFLSCKRHFEPRTPTERALPARASPVMPGAAPDPA